MKMGKKSRKVEKVGDLEKLLALIGNSIPEEKITRNKGQPFAYEFSLGKNKIILEKGADPMDIVTLKIKVITLFQHQKSLNNS